ncbi:MAG: HNH endonuclease [Verrucomicrobiales bacterium]
MRPDRPRPAPQAFSDYAEAKPFLVERLGLYCSYCERPIKTNLAVEHVLPKSLHPDLEREWSNFTLGCVNCNSTKKDKPVDRRALILPDQDNSFLAFQYHERGVVVADPALGEEIATKAGATLRLVGLDKFPDELLDEEGDPERAELEFTAALERWQQRSQCFQTARESLADLHSADTPEMRRTTLRLALATGFFSVWMAVFQDEPALRAALVETFPGTARDCFDEDGTPLPRPGGIR